MSAAPDSEQSDMEAAFGIGGHSAKDVVENAEKERGMQQEREKSQEVSGVVEGGEEAPSAYVPAPAVAGDKGGSCASLPAGGTEYGEDDIRAHSQGPDQIADPTHREHGNVNSPQIQTEGAFHEQTTAQPRSGGRDDDHPRIKCELPENEQTTNMKRLDGKLSHLPNKSNEPQASEQADNPPRTEIGLTSSPRPTYSGGSGEQTYGPTSHDEPQSEPSSDSVFLLEIDAHFGEHNCASGSHSVLSEDPLDNLLKGTLEYSPEVNRRNDLQDTHPDLAASANPPKDLRPISHEKGLLSGIRDGPGIQQRSGRLENVRHNHVSHGPIDGALWNGQKGYNDLQQPRSMLHSPPYPHPSYRSMMPNPHNREIYTPQFTPGTSYNTHGSRPSPSMHGYQVPDRAMHEQRVSAQPFRKDYLLIQTPVKRKHQEEPDEDGEEPEVEDDYVPSDSGDDEDSDSDTDSDQQSMYPKTAAEASTRRKRAGSSQSEYQDEGGEDQDEDQGEESEDQDRDQREGSGNASEEVKAAMKEEMEPVQHMDVDSRSPTQEPFQDAVEPSSSFTTELALISAPSAEPPAIQRALPILQPDIVPEAPPSDEISFKLPQFYVEVIPIKTKDDYPEVRVNLPGMIRESLILTPDHTHQEIHLLKHLFMPGQQSLATPDPEPMTALLNFHTIATMVLEAYTAYEFGDLEAKTSSSSSSAKKNNDAEALDATKDEIFFAVMDRWRVGLAEETLRPSYKLIRGVQEFCDIALDVIYYLEEHGFVEGPQTIRKERSDKGVKKSKDETSREKAGTGGDSEEADASEVSTPKKRGRPSNAQSESPAKGKAKAKGDVNTLHARKKAKTTPNPKASTKKQPKVKKEPGLSVVPRKK